MEPTKAEMKLIGNHVIEEIKIRFLYVGFKDAVHYICDIKLDNYDPNDVRTWVTTSFDSRREVVRLLKLAAERETRHSKDETARRQQEDKDMRMHEGDYE